MYLLKTILIKSKQIREVHEVNKWVDNGFDQEHRILFLIERILFHYSVDKEKVASNNA